MTTATATAIPDALLIDGEWHRSASGGTIELTEPATEQPLAAVPAAGKKELDRAIEGAAQAFESESWRDAEPGHRTEVLYKIAAGIRARGEELARLEARNVGKAIGDARWEVNAGARVFDYYAGAISRFWGKTVPLSALGLNYTLNVPIGVVASIVPWNFPFLMACWKTAPALATGNAVVLKPASQTPLTALALGQIAMAAGVPPGILQVVAGRGSEIGDRLVTHPLVGKISFTGETTTGARIVEKSAHDIKRVSLELGGKSPNIVFADADVDEAASRSPMGVFANTGQDCCARSLVLVEKSVYDRFLEGYLAATRALVVGDPLDDATEVGPMVSAGQRATSEEYLSIARAEGGRILCGGERSRSPGYYLTPAVVDRVDFASRVCQEEIFGPVAVVLPFASEAEAIKLANGTVYGLSGSLWTRDVGRALRVARAVRSGVLGVNTTRSVFTEMPFGGFKHSGTGRDLGMEAMGLYTEIKSVYLEVKPG
jgi:acyl-CoA reductase-like NAD-dependent aldehyde dehydrogenase